jgi:hypothetical protein
MTKVGKSKLGKRRSPPEILAFVDIIGLVTFALNSTFPGSQAGILRANVRVSIGSLLHHRAILLIR